MKKILLLLVLFSANAEALEKDYQHAWCPAHAGVEEYILPDRTRIDCLTDTHAIEFDFGHKWAESIGQALWYAANTGRRAGIVLIVAPDEQRYLKRLNGTIVHYGLPIDVWTVPK